MNDASFIFVSKYEISRLDVSMDEIKTVQISYALKHLVKKHASCFKTKPSATHFKQVFKSKT